MLERDAHGRLRLTAPDGTPHIGVVPVRAFPIDAPLDGLSMVDTDGREVAWVPRLTDLTEDLRKLIEEELAAREFMPQIRRIVSVSTFSTPSLWQVETDRGEARLVLKGEEDIRRLKNGALWISDSHGIAYVIPKRQDLDRQSRRMLERFL
jgi:hypothetical protein